ncbi:protein mono-ADP-ribosyltransferase PARP4 [Pelomyxa schiedti]|nr:protein mono-ADP-ribosyltransferase PARP4 [Pelomyxa schiedti]
MSGTWSGLCDADSSGCLGSATSRRTADYGTFWADGQPHGVRVEPERLFESQSTVSGSWLHRVVPVFDASDVCGGMPYFPESYFVIRRDVMKRTCGTIDKVMVVELHAADESPYLRIVLTQGSPSAFERGRASSQMQFASTMHDALVIYASILRERTMHNKYKKMLLASSKYGTSIGLPRLIPLAVANLLEVLYKETTVSLSLHGTDSLPAISPPQITKAFSILQKVFQALENSDPLDDTTAESLSSEFFSAISGKKQLINTSDKANEWTLFLQNLKDVSSLSESSLDLVSVNLDVDILYHSIACDISVLSNETSEYMNVYDFIEKHNSSKFKIGTIYRVHRHMDFTNFDSTIGNETNLFHGSPTGTWLGILSRGMILPMIVSTKYHVQRNGGNLGGALYYTDDLSASLKYTTPSNEGVRYISISRVALGKVKDFTQFCPSLHCAPSGFNSCHGVKSSPLVRSNFEDNEYAIFQTSQQYLQFLVEILDAEVVPCTKRRTINPPPVPTPLRTAKAPITKYVEPDDPELWSKKKKPKEQCGLMSDTGQPIPLQAVSIHAKLVDIVGQVVVLQEYFNSSSTAIEAKYVFPLDEKSAVVGFECFIADKHIIGVVKEKEEAHREYKEAIERGDGAYLLDEAQPNVFTVSVGNLPPSTNVIIKITYITEIESEGDARKFICPSSLVAKQKFSALDHMNQVTTKSINVSQSQGSFSMEISVNMPNLIRSIESTSHSIRYKYTAKKATILWIEENPTSDFTLLVHLSDSHVPFMWIETAPPEVSVPDSERNVAMVVMYPELAELNELESQYILIVDQSCSMSDSLLLTKQVASHIVSLIPAFSLFNVVAYGSFYDFLFASSMPCTAHTTEEATTYIQSLQADWGASLLWPVIKSVITTLEWQSRCKQSKCSGTTNILLVSDGDFTHENQVIQMVADHCRKVPSTRFFTFGIGQNVNKQNLTRISRLGCGATTFIESSNSVRQQVKLQLSRTRQASLSNTVIEWSNCSAETEHAPKNIQTLFSNDRLLVFRFVPESCHKVTLKSYGSSMLTAYQCTIVSNLAERLTGMTLHRLCARAKTRDWEDLAFEDSTLKDLQKRDILELALRYSLATTLTSFIAIEERDDTEKLGTLKKPTPTLHSLANKEKTDEIPFCTNWKTQSLSEKLHSPSKALSKRRAGRNRTVYDAWSPEIHRAEPQLQVKDPYWTLTWEENHEKTYTYKTKGKDIDKRVDQHSIELPSMSAVLDCCGSVCLCIFCLPCLCLLGGCGGTLSAKAAPRTFGKQYAMKCDDEYDDDWSVPCSAPAASIACGHGRSLALGGLPGSQVETTIKASRRGPSPATHRHHKHAHLAPPPPQASPKNQKTPDKPSNLLQQIQNGKQLKKEEPKSGKRDVDMRVRPSDDIDYMKPSAARSSNRNTAAAAATTTSSTTTTAGTSASKPAAAVSLGGKFCEYSEATIGAAFQCVGVKTPNGNAKLELWDTAGQERYRSLSPMYYRGATAAMVVYDITSMESFTLARQWMDELKMRAPPDIVVILLGNKLDLAEKRQVSTGAGSSLAAEYGIQFFEVSAKTTENLSAAISAMVSEIFANPKSRAMKVVVVGGTNVGKSSINQRLSGSSLSVDKDVPDPSFPPSRPYSSQHHQKHKHCL